jgi:hypothetical protein
MNVPDWWTLTLLGLAAYRVYRLFAMDTILDIPRAWLVGLGGWREGQATPPGYRSRLAEFLICPWCLGFWVALSWWAAWQQWPHGTLVAAAPFAISAVVGILGEVTAD